MEICLHIGAHRTGTTSFQMFMHDNRARFADDGLAFWGPGRTRNGLMAGLVRDPNMLTKSSLKTGQRSIGRIHIELARAMQMGAKRLVVSEENMIGTMAENLENHRLYGNARARLGRFAPAFGGHPLRIGVAIRSYDSFWASSLAFRIRSGHPLPDDDALDQMVTQPRRWRHLITDISEVFPEAEIAVWSFEAWAGQPQQQLAALTGRLVPVGPHVLREPCNTSMSAAEIGQIAAERGDVTTAEDLLMQEGRYMPFNHDHITKLRQDYAADIDWLKNSAAEGLATYFDPIGDTSDGLQDARGRRNAEENRRARRHVRPGRPERAIPQRRMEGTG